MDNSFYLKNGSVLWNGAFTPWTWRWRTGTSPP